MLLRRYWHPVYALDGLGPDRRLPHGRRAGAEDAVTSRTRYAGVRNRYARCFGSFRVNPLPSIAPIVRVAGAKCNGCVPISDAVKTDFNA